MTPSKIFLYFCLSFIGGIFISSMLGFLPGSEVYLLLPGLILGVILISVFWKHKKFVVIGFCVLFLVLGISRHQMAEIQISKFSAFAKAASFAEVATKAESADKQIPNGEKVALIGIIVAEPDIREKSQKLTIKIEKIKEDGPPSFYGRVAVTAGRYPEYQYGDKLKITGRLLAPSPDINGFNYKDYLKKDGIYSVMSFPEIELIGQGLGNPLMEILFSFKNKFKETAQSFIPPPQIGILEALVFGDENNISNEWKVKLNLSGTRHIAAVSGMNITIISGLILNFLLMLGLWRGQAFYVSIILIMLYILMLGAPASAVRAGVMAGLFLLAQQLGRISAASRAIVFASTFMLAQNPLLLRLDVGFQLSFLAMMGLIYLQPFFSNLLKKIPNPKFFPIKTTLSATLSAQVFTLPILLYNFGYFSLVSPVPNILIVPFLAPITILIFIFGLSGMIFWPLGWLVSLPTFFALAYITKTIDFFSKIPPASLNLENLSWAWPIIFYFILGFVVWRLQERQKLKFLNY